MIISPINNSYFTFSGGEVHCKVDLEKIRPKITMHDYAMNGFMALCEYKEVLERLGIFNINLVYGYFPYARQDRIMAKDEPFSLKIFCDLLNTQKFRTVTILDPHSDVAPALIDNCYVIPQWEIARKVIPTELLNDSDVLFVSPDAGAYKKLSKLIKDDSRIIIGVKNRNISGEITHTHTYSSVPIKDKTCVIVDDICDGGRTFIELAKNLKELGAKNIVLYITHGIFSKGTQILTDAGIDHIYTTNSFSESGQSNEFLTIVDYL